MLLAIQEQCDRSAVGALWVEVPRVARRLAALARARPTAISFDRSAVVRGVNRRAPKRFAQLAMSRRPVVVRLPSTADFQLIGNDARLEVRLAAAIR